MRIRIINSIVIMSAAASLGAAKETKTFDASNIKQLRIEHVEGDISLKAGDTGSVEIKPEDFDPENCSLEVKETGGELFIKVQEKSDKGFFGTDCEIDFVIQMAASTTYDISLGAGNVDLTGMTGAGDVRVGAGNIDGTKLVSSDLEIKTGAGNITADGNSIVGEFAVGAGNVTVALSESTAKGQLKVSVGTGNADVSLPKAAKVAADLETGLGNAVNEFSKTEEANAEFNLVMRAGLGNVTVSAKKL